MATRIASSTPVHAHACERGEMCASQRAGHGLSAIQDRLARATPRHWADAVVTAIGADGTLTVRLLDDEVEFRVWTHTPRPAAVGEPVAVHTAYHVLAVGAQRYNVAVTL